MSGPIAEFATEVGSSGPVVAVGARTQWHVGGEADPAAREVRAPAGVVEYEPAEMTVRLGAGTAVCELDDALAAHGQMCPLDPRDPAATVGGTLAVGHSGIRRLRYGHIRDLVLQVRYVAHDGTVVTAGGPTVKNVSGYDLVRLMVGALGTLGFLAEVTLRCLPLPEASRWLTGDTDPFEVVGRLYRPSSVLWDGASTWVLLEGARDDVDAESGRSGLEECDGPPALPRGGRESLRPGALRTLSGDFVAEVGVGVVHRPHPVDADPVANRGLNEELKRRFDPSGRLNPGRSVLA